MTIVRLEKIREQFNNFLKKNWLNIRKKPSIRINLCLYPRESTYPQKNICRAERLLVLLLEGREREKREIFDEKEFVIRVVESYSIFLPSLAQL